MSTYVREKVLRIPRHRLNFAHIVRKLEEKFPNEDVMDDLGYYIENVLPDYDRDRFYVSHMKKVVDWYSCLKNYATLDFVQDEEQEEAAAE